MKCHYTYVPDVGRVFIPGCMGAAVAGIRNCTCHHQTTFEQFERERYNETVRSLRLEKKELEQENARLNQIIRNLIKK